MVLNKVAQCLALLFAALFLVDVTAEELVVEGLMIVPIDRIDVPARATGLMAEVFVREGDAVTTSQSLARLDASQVTVEAERAATQYRISEQAATSNVDLDLARKTLERADQTARVQAIVSDIAHRKAGNDIRVRAAQKAEAAANNELQRATDARKTYADSVSLSEIDGLTLAWQRSQLETKQSAFDKEMNELTAKSEASLSVEQRLAIDFARLKVDQTMAEQAIAVLKAKSASQDLALAELAVLRHELIAPIDGVITNIHRHAGQWVQMGEPVLELMRVDRLRAEGYVSQEQAILLRQLPTVTLTFSGAAAAIDSRSGKVVFVRSELDPVNGEVQFWCEFDNPLRDALPGMRASIRVLEN